MWIILTFVAIACVMIGLFLVAADAIERRWARRDAWTHPPDREDDRRDEP